MTISGGSNELTGIIVGSPVTGGDFFDREQELRELADLVRHGAHVMITAPRRIGKTSLLLETARRLGDSFAFLFVDLEACVDEADAVLKLAQTAGDHRDLRQKIHDAFRNVLGPLSRLEEVGVSELSLKLRQGIQPDWREKASEICERLAGVGRPVVVALDELPVLVSALLSGDDRRMTPERITRTRVFLSWLREATIRHRGKIIFLVSGSIGLEPLLTRAGISETMTTFTPLPIGPWERPTALEYLKDRAGRAGVTFAEGAAERLVDQIGYLIPHHVALFMHFIRRDARRRDASRCTQEDVDRIYGQDMLSVHGHVDLATYEERLTRVVPPETLRAALELLTEAAVVGQLTPVSGLGIVTGHGFHGTEAAATLRFLLGVFDHDGYLKRAGENYVFASHLLRDWWRNRFGFGYVPTGQRGDDAR